MDFQLKAGKREGNISTDISFRNYIAVTDKHINFKKVQMVSNHRNEWTKALVYLRRQVLFAIHSSIKS